MLGEVISANKANKAGRWGNLVMTAPHVRSLCSNRSLLFISPPPTIRVRNVRQHGYRAEVGSRQILTWMPPDVLSPRIVCHGRSRLNPINGTNSGVGIRGATMRC